MDLKSLRVIPRVAVWMGVVVSAATVGAVTVGAATVGACSSGADVPGVGGTEGRARWVVTFEGKAPDLTEYRSLLAASAADAAAYVDRKRSGLPAAHAAFEASLQTVNGRIVEVWWMSNAVTIEADASAMPTLRSADDVESIVPDAVLGG